MPGISRQLTLSAARAHIHERCLQPSPTTGTVGLECEWHVVPARNLLGTVSLFALRDMIDPLLPLPGGSSITYEPGGQIELSGPAAIGFGAAHEAMARDIDIVRRVLAMHDIELVGAGVDPWRSPRRELHAPRYDAMETYFDTHGPHGRVMMTRTASVQVNLDNGRAEQMESRWRLAHALGPTLVAMFANSPLAEGVPTGWRSTRLANWWAMDRGRTGPVGDHTSMASWADYALGARVMLMRAKADCYVPVTTALTFGGWIEQGHILGHPTMDDLDYHLTTLFPPVRPRGWLEIRYLDALSLHWWPVVAAVTTVLMDDEEAASIAQRATRETVGRWMVAARDALGDDDLATSAATCMGAALDALDRAHVDGRLLDLCADYADRYVERRRTPADDSLDAWWTRAEPCPATNARVAQWV